MKWFLFLFFILGLKVVKKEEVGTRVAMGWKGMNENSISTKKIKNPNYLNL